MKYLTSEFENLTVVYPTDCGNAPKKVLLKDFHIAVHTNDHAFIFDMLHDDCFWDMIGHEQIEGKEQVLNKLVHLYTSKPSKLWIKHIIAHGKITSIHGDVTLENNDVFSFCHVHIFNNASKQAKIKETTSYIIKVSS